jgi:hypothetical protein
MEGPQELAEETGPRLAEMLLVTRNQGRWKARWDMLYERKSVAWGQWKGRAASETREAFKEMLKSESSKPACPICGAPMRRIRPRRDDQWKEFWGCTQFKVTGCKGSIKFNA